MTKVKTRTRFFFAVFPWIWLGGLLLLVVRARILLGQWPHPAHPDPKRLPFEVHYTVLWLGLYGLMLALPLMAIACLASFIRKKNMEMQPLLIFSGGCSVILVMVLSPHSAINWVAWFLD